MSRMTALAALLLLCAGPALAADAPPDGRALFDRVVDTYRHLDRYHFEGTVSLRVTAGGNQQSFDIPMVVAHAKPGHERIEMKHPTMGMLVVDDGAHLTTWVAQTNRYLVKDAPPAPPDSLPAMAPAGSPIGRWFNIEANLKEARVVRAEKVMVGGTPVDCWVVESTADPVAAMNGDSTASVTSTVWVDKQRTLVMRDSTHVHSEHSPAGGPLEMTQTIVLTHASAGAPVPDSLFTFRPPAGSQAGDANELMGKPKMPDLTGQTAAAFTLKDLLGRSRSLAAYRGKVVLLDFWATWCGPCRIELPRVEKLAKEYKLKGLVTFLVNVGESADRVKPFLAQNHYTQTVLLDPEMTVAAQYKADAIPTLVVIGKTGKVVAYFTGVREEQDLRDALKKAGL